MLITEERRVRIKGRVISVRKVDPRANNREMRNAVIACEEYTIPEMQTRINRAEQTVRHVAPMVKQGTPMVCRVSCHGRQAAHRR